MSNASNAQQFNMLIRSPLLQADDTSFNQLVLKARLPTIVLFSTLWCAEHLPCIDTFSGLAQRYWQQVRVVIVDIDESVVITESFGAQSVPIYMLFRDGEPLAYGLGYMPRLLLDRFFQLAITLERRLNAQWLPTEHEIEDTLIEPMLVRWGWFCQRQYECRVRGATRSRRGVVDMLVSVNTARRPLTLFENKRLIREHADLQRAADQALAYAIALNLGSFVVADARGMWVYQVYENRALLAAQFAGYTLEQDDTALRDLLLALGGDAL